MSKRVRQFFRKEKAKKKAKEAKKKEKKASEIHVHPVYGRVVRGGPNAWIQETRERVVTRNMIQQDLQQAIDRVREMNAGTPDALVVGPTAQSFIASSFVNIPAF